MAATISQLSARDTSTPFLPRQPRQVLKGVSSSPLSNYCKNEREKRERERERERRERGRRERDATHSSHLGILSTLTTGVGGTADLGLAAARAMNDPLLEVDNPTYALSAAVGAAPSMDTETNASNAIGTGNSNGDNNNNNNNNNNSEGGGGGGNGRNVAPPPSIPPPPSVATAAAALETRRRGGAEDGDEDGDGDDVDEDTVSAISTGSLSLPSANGMDLARLQVCLSVCLSVNIYIYICLSVYLSIYLSVYLSVYLSICLSVYSELSSTIPPTEREQGGDEGAVSLARPPRDHEHPPAHDSGRWWKDG